MKLAELPQFFGLYVVITPTLVTSHSWSGDKIAYVLWALSHKYGLPLWYLDFPSSPSGKQPDCPCRRHKRHGFKSCVGPKAPAHSLEHPVTIVWEKFYCIELSSYSSCFVFFLATPGVGDGQGGLACCDSWGRKESDMTERLIWSALIPHDV